MEVEEKEVGVQEEGKPVVEPASKPTEQATDDGVVILDTTKKYRSKRDPTKNVSGDELWAGFGRGERFNKLQSEYQKLESDAATKDQRIAALESQVTASATKEQIAQSIQDLGLAGGQKPVADPDDDWLDTEKPVQPLNPRITANRIEETVKKTTEDFLANLVPEIKETVIGESKQEREEQELQTQRKQIADQLKAAKIAALKVEYPDASDADIDDVASRIIEYTGHVYKAADSYGAKNVAEGNEALFDGEEKLIALLKRQAELGQKQIAINATREREAELEGLGSGILPGEEPDEKELEPEFNWHKSEKKRETRLERAKAMMTRRAALKNSGM